MCVAPIGFTPIAEPPEQPATANAKTDAEIKDTKNLDILGIAFTNKQG
jgi:hypothetical protein